MKLQALAIITLLLASMTSAQEDGHSHGEAVDEEILATGPLYLRTDGSLSNQEGQSAQECIAVDAQTGAQSTTFTTALTTLDHHIESATVILSLAFTPGSTPGSGFQLDAELAHGQNSPTTASKTYAAGTSLETPITLAFDVGSQSETHDELTLAITMTPTTVAGILPGLLDVGIQCDTSDSRFHSFDYAVFDDHMEPGEDPHDDGEFNPLFVILISIGAAVVTLIAGILPLIGRALEPKRMHLFLGITAGLLLSIALVDLIPSAVEGGGHSVAWTIALGLLVLYAVKHFAGETHDHASHGDHPQHHDPDPDDEHTDPHAGRFAVVAFGALLFHRFVDGLALPGAFAAGGEVGFAAGAAVLLHQFPDGLAAASVFIAAGWKKSKVLWAVLLLAFATPVGSLIGLAFAGIDGALPHLLGLAAATFIFIALAELLPELQSKKYRTIVVIGFLLGYALTFGIELFAEIFGGSTHSH